MARFNEILVGRFNRSLQKLFAMKGGPPAPQLASEVSVNHQLLSGVENRYLEGWNRFGVSVQVAAGGAGNRSAFRIRNPKGSNVIGVIEKWTVLATATIDQPFIDYAILDPGTLNIGSVGTVNSGLDNRGSPTANLDLSSSVAAVGLQGVQVLQAALALNTSWEFMNFEDQELTVLPNSA